MTAAMLDEGAGTRSALEIADAVEFLGADLCSSSGLDSSAVRLHVPVARLADALPIMADVALRPTFPAPELDERARQQRLTSLLQARDDPGAILATSVPAHPVRADAPLWHVCFGTTATGLAAMTVDDLKAFYTGQFRPDQRGDRVLATRRRTGRGA